MNRKSAKGVVGELLVMIKYISKGFYVARSSDPLCPFDLVVVDKNGVCKLIDVKSVSIRKSGRQEGHKINRSLTAKQRRMKVRIEYVNTKTVV
tara:strand:+ start:430 stop:708 length:279 start_codon:yes stop_codon:yes gene_type:complete